MKPKKTFKPQTLRGLLITLLILVAIAGGGLFYLGLNYVREYAVEVNHRLKDAEASATQIDGLRALRSQLNESESVTANGYSTCNTNGATIEDGDVGTCWANINNNGWKRTVFSGR